MKKKAVKANLKRVEDCTGRIDDWIKKSETRQAETTQSHFKIDFADLGVIQANATKLYQTLSRSCCKKKTQHAIFLLLEQRFQRRRRARRAQHNLTASSNFDGTCFSLSIRGDCFVQIPHFHTEIRVSQHLFRLVRMHLDVLFLLTVNNRPPTPRKVLDLLPNPVGSDFMHPLVTIRT